MKRCLALLLLPLIWAGCQSAPAEQTTLHPQTEHFAAFARLYGYVRFFHPSDEAARIDWDRFAVYGARTVAGVESRDQLRSTLEELFLPLAPTLRIYAEGEKPASLPPADAEGRVLVAWQHSGVGLVPDGLYRSARLNRPVDPLKLTNSASRYIDNEDYKDHRFRFSARARAQVEEGNNGGRLFLQVMNEGFQTYIDEDSRDRLATAPTWEPIEVTGTFDQGTRFITYGIGLAGIGEACFDDVRFEVAPPGGEWRQLQVENGGFETAVVGAPRSWDFDGYGYQFVATEKGAYEGKRSGCIRSADAYLAGSLFDAAPEAGEEIDKDLGAGLRARLPIALLLEENAPAESPEEFGEPLDSFEDAELDSLRGDDLPTRVAGIAIAWNIFQHFYPYFDVVAADWNRVLPSAIDRTIGDRTARDYLDTLRWLLAQLEDGHAGAFHPELFSAQVDVEFGWIEDQLVVLDCLEGSGLQVGDVVETIGAAPSATVLASSVASRSGSPQWRRRRALLALTPGPAGAPVALGLRRGEERFAVEVPRVIESERQRNTEALRRLDGDIWLVDLSRASMAEINQHIAELASARGVVFDLRGYPNSNHDVLRHLTDEPLKSAQWQVPQVIYPDRVRLAGYNTSGRWTLDPREPRFEGKVVFLTDARAISYAESFMGIVEHYRLGEIVGEPTAGTNGNVNWMTLPGGYRVNWTGMRVIKHDGSQHHLIGIQPTVPATRTVAGVRAGRDEFLETALELIGD